MAAERPEDLTCPGCAHLLTKHADKGCHGAYCRCPLTSVEVTYSAGLAAGEARATARIVAWLRVAPVAYSHDNEVMATRHFALVAAAETIEEFGEHLGVPGSTEEASRG